MKIFIPDLKKQYALLEDAEITLYPFSHSMSKYSDSPVKEETGLVDVSLYGKIKKEKFSFLFDVVIKKYDESERKWYSQDFFGVTEKKYDDELLDTFKNPDDFSKLVHDVYTIYIPCLNSDGNESYSVFISKKDCEEMEKMGIDNNIKTRINQRCFKSLKEVEDIVRPYEKMSISIQDFIYYSSLKAGCMYKNKIGNEVPIKYTVKNGSQIKLIKLSYKMRYPKQKYLFLKLK